MKQMYENTAVVNCHISSIFHLFFSYPSLAVTSRLMSLLFTQLRQCFAPNQE